MTEQTTELQKTEDKNNPAYLLQLAIEQKADIGQLEKLMELQERYTRNQATKEFNLAMAKFQKECPVIEKKKIVKGKDGSVRYKFAPLGDISNQISKPLSDNDLFYDFATEDSNEFMKVICTITHAKGHSKSSDFKVPIGKEDYMTDVQKYGARLSFAKRYALCNALGITTADEDNDGGKDEVKKQTSNIPETKNENAFTKKDEESISKKLDKCTTEKRVIDVFYDYPQYQSNIIFKAMIQKRTSSILPACKFATDKERKNYHFEKKTALMQKK